MNFKYSDGNGDKYLNPGFAVPTNLTAAEYGVLGYRSSDVELPQGECFSGMFLSFSYMKWKFE